jgi:glutamate dehydrogenase (NADP+)
MLAKNGCMAVSEGGKHADRPRRRSRVQDSEILHAVSKAAKADGVVVSGLELSQNPARIPWEEAELQKMLGNINITHGIHYRCTEYGGVAGSKHNDYVKGANIAAFKKSRRRDASLRCRLASASSSLIFTFQRV